MKRFGQNDAKVWYCSGFCLYFLLWLFHFMLLFRPCFGPRLFYLYILLLLLSLLRYAYFCLSGVSFVSVWASKLWKTVVTSSRLLADLVGWLMQPWGQVKANHSTTSRQTACSTTGHQRGSVADVYLETRSRVTRLKTFFLNFYSFIADLMYFLLMYLHLLLSVSAGCVRLEFNDLAGALMMFYWSLWWFLRFFFFF